MHNAERASMRRFEWIAVLIYVLLVADTRAAGSEPGGVYRVRLDVQSELPFAKVPMDPMIDFGKLISKTRDKGVLDPNSIRIVNIETGKAVSHALSEHFGYADKGRVLWLISHPDHREFEVRFRTTRTRPARIPQRHTPMIGVGDLLHYNASTPRPSVLRFPSRLVDLTGDGKLDLVGAMAHIYAPHTPNGGIVCYPRVGSADRFEFGDMVRLRYLNQRSDQEFHHFIGPHQWSPH